MKIEASALFPLAQINTPAAVIDVAKLAANIDRMQTRMSALGVRFRPHVKTSKCADVVRLQMRAGASGITVSTLKEAEQFFAAGIAPHNCRRLQR